MPGRAPGGAIWEARAPGSALGRSRPGPATVGEALQAGARRLAGAGVETARLDAECLLAEAIGLERWRLFLSRDRILTAAEGEAYGALVHRRARREPVAYIRGRKEFWSLSLAVGPGVLIPRPETEALVEVALAKLGRRRSGEGSGGDPGASPSPRPDPRGPTVVDVGTGSGAILLALASEIGRGVFWGTELSAAALGTARANVGRLGWGDAVHLEGGDLLEPLRGRGLEGGADLIVANPPYVRTGEWGRLPPEIREYEPREALDGGPDGLGVIRRLVAAALPWLRPGGWLVVEIGWDQAEAVASLVRAGGSDAVETVRDLAGRDRVIAGRRSPA